MSLLTMLKKGRPQGFANAKAANVANVGTVTPSTLATLATIALANLQKPAANDPTVTTTVQVDLPTPDVKGLPTTPDDGASGVQIDIGTVRPPGLSAKLLAASLALDAQIVAAGLDTDRHATATRNESADLYAARLARFSTKGLPSTDAQAQADRLVQRDSDSDDRRLCLECSHLAGYGASSWRCGNWNAAGIAVSPRSTQLAAGLVFQLQRCPGFAAPTFQIITTKVST